MVQALCCVHKAFVSQGSGRLDFEAELRAYRPDIFIVNHDGHSEEKRALCESLDIRYLVLARTPHPGLPVRSTTSLRIVERMPFRLDLAGGWLDQPFVSRHHPGAVVTVSLEPNHPFNARSGMASSTRAKALELWGPQLPAGDPEHLARILFAYDNPPGTEVVSGSQDAIGIVFPGLARSHYRGTYWPERIDTLREAAALDFVENALALLPLAPREDRYDPLEDTRIQAEAAAALAAAADGLWEAILARDIEAFGRAMRQGFEAQVSMFPRMMTPELAELLESHQDSLGYKLSGAGGGGYLVLVSEKPLTGTLRLRVRR